MHILNLAVMVPPSRTQSGSEILCRFDLDLGPAVVRDLALVRAASGKLAVWSKRSGGERHPIVAFTRETNLQIIDQLTGTMPSLASQVAA